MAQTSLAGRELYATIGTQVVAASTELLGGGKVPGVHDMYTTLVPGFEGKKTLEANIVGPSPALRVFDGARQHQQLRGYVHTATTKKYEATLDIPVSDYEADTSGGAIRERVGRMLRMAQGPGIGKIVYDFLHTTNGPTTTDGVAFFSASHVHVGSTTGTGSNTGTTAFSASQANAVDLIMTQYKNESGDLLGVYGDTIRCGQKILPYVREVFEADNRLETATAGSVLDAAASAVAAGGVGNVWKGTKNVIMDPRITDSSYYIHDTSKGEKSVLMAYSRPFQLLSQTGPDSDAVYERDVFSFGLIVEFVLLAVNWQLIHRNVVS